MGNMDNSVCLSHLQWGVCVGRVDREVGEVKEQRLAAIVSLRRSFKGKSISFCDQDQDQDQDKQKEDSKLRGKGTRACYSCDR